VVKALIEQGLLPRVISGSSAGSLVAGVVGTHTDLELEHFFDPDNVHFEAEREASIVSFLGGASDEMFEGPVVKQ
jgi:NTE family protein